MKAPLINQIEQILTERYMNRMSKQEAVQSILTAFDTFLGEDERDEFRDSMGMPYGTALNARNELRQELKAKLKKEGV